MVKFSVMPMKYPVLRVAGLASVRGAMFGMTRNGGRRAHQGVDLAADRGYRCYAVEDGVVVLTATEFAGHGMVVMIELDCVEKPELHGKFAFYSHLSRVSVKPGERVAAGRIIGLTGDSGNARGMVTVATGGHLHFELRTKRVAGPGLSDRVDPGKYIF
jgi:murein DD-endopeptidase MepM/ murein hydrolase activator NlpD